MVQDYQLRKHTSTLYLEARKISTLVLLFVKEKISIVARMRLQILSCKELLAVPL